MDRSSQAGIYNHVRVGLSQTEGLNDSAPGVGLYAYAAGKKRTVFKCGDVVLPTISGALAMRTEGAGGKKVDWLVDGCTFTGLKEDCCVIWSGAEIPVACGQNGLRGKRRVVELGCRPDDYGVYLNHSSNPNATVYASYENDLTNKKTSTNILASNPVDGSTVSYQINATKTIQNGDEIFWSYAPSPDFSGKEYRAAFYYERDSGLAKKCISTLTGIDEHKLEYVPAAKEFDQQRWEKNLAPKSRNLQLDESEKKIRNESLTLKGRFQLKEALLKCKNKKKLKHKVLITYLKFKLMKNGDLTETLESVRTVLRRMPKIDTLIDCKGRCTLAEIYQYCVDNGLIIPDDDPSSIPLGWLAMKLRATGGGGNLYLSKLLANRIRSVLIYPDCGRSALLSNLRAVKMPNPLHQGRVEWTLFDLESLTGYTCHADPDADDLKVLTKQYLKCDARQARLLGKKIAEIAKRGNVEAIKATILRRLSGKTTRNELLDDFKKTGINLVVKGKNRTPDLVSLKAFVREHCEHEELITIKGYWWCTDSELINYLKTKRKLATSVNSEICCRIKAGHRNLMKPYIQVCAGSGEIYWSTLLRQLRTAKIFTAQGKIFDKGSVEKLLTQAQVAKMPRVRKSNSKR